MAAAAASTASESRPPQCMQGAHGAYRLCPEERARLAREAFETSRRRRLLQVRAQDKLHAAQKRRAYQDNLRQIQEQLIQTLKEQWSKDQAGKVAALNQKYQWALGTIGEAHRDAGAERDLTAKAAAEQAEAAALYRLREQQRFQLAIQEDEQARLAAEQNQLLEAQKVQTALQRAAEQRELLLLRMNKMKRKLEEQEQEQEKRMVQEEVVTAEHMRPASSARQVAGRELLRSVLESERAAAMRKESELRAQERAFAAELRLRVEKARKDMQEELEKAARESRQARVRALRLEQPGAAPNPSQGSQRPYRVRFQEEPQLGTPAKRSERPATMTQSSTQTSHEFSQREEMGVQVGDDLPYVSQADEIKRMQGSPIQWVKQPLSTVPEPSLDALERLSLSSSSGSSSLWGSDLQALREELEWEYGNIGKQHVPVDGDVHGAAAAAAAVTAAAVAEAERHAQKQWQDQSLHVQHAGSQEAALPSSPAPSTGPSFQTLSPLSGLSPLSSLLSPLSFEAREELPPPMKHERTSPSDHSSSPLDRALHEAHLATESLPTTLSASSDALQQVSIVPTTTTRSGTSPAASLTLSLPATSSFPSLEPVNEGDSPLPQLKSLDAILGAIARQVQDLDSQLRSSPADGASSPALETDREASGLEERSHTPEFAVNRTSEEPSRSVSPRTQRLLEHAFDRLMEEEQEPMFQSTEQPPHDALQEEGRSVDTCDTSTLQSVLTSPLLSTESQPAGKQQPTQIEPEEKTNQRAKADESAALPLPVQQLLSPGTGPAFTSEEQEEDWLQRLRKGKAVAAAADDVIASDRDSSSRYSFGSSAQLLRSSGASSISVHPSELNTSLSDISNISDILEDVPEAFGNIGSPRAMDDWQSLMRGSISDVEGFFATDVETVIQDITGMQPEQASLHHRPQGKEAALTQAESDEYADLLEALQRSIKEYDVSVSPGHVPASTSRMRGSSPQSQSASQARAGAPAAVKITPRFVSSDVPQQETSSAERSGRRQNKRAWH